MVTGRGLIVYSFYYFDIVEQNFIGGTSSPELKDRLLNTQYIFSVQYFVLALHSLHYMKLRVKWLLFEDYNI